MEKPNPIKENVTEKACKAYPGIPLLLLACALLPGSIYLLVQGIMHTSADNSAAWPFFIACIMVCCLSLLIFGGLVILHPNEAAVFTLFGKYYGTLKQAGFYYVNLFASAYRPETTASDLAGYLEDGEAGKNEKKKNIIPNKKISLKTTTLNNSRQKVNDILGNPIIIGSIVIWRVIDPTKAVFNVENYQDFLSIQCDSTIRNIARLYPYDTFTEDEQESDETTLRGSAVEIAVRMQKELQERVDEAGLLIEDVRITHLSYAEEIAAAMLQRQQAVAVIAARQKIVEGAVGMVQMAIDTLSKDETVVLDEERKASMVSNLMVVLCGNKEVQPVVNSGSLY